MSSEVSAKARVVVLISGRGSNLKALLDDAQQADCPYQIVAVCSNRSKAQGLGYAQAADIPTAVLPAKGYADRVSYDRAMRDLIDTYQPDFVALAGFMRILSGEFVQYYAQRLINIHPSLLPDFKGLDTHQQALDAGVKAHGATVHFVTEELDAGPIIEQAAVPVQPGDDAERLAARVLTVEHQIYPRALRRLALSCLGKG